METFQQFIDIDVSDISTLYLAHTTEAFYFRDIILNRKLMISECDVFKKKLLYLFYGKPEYRTNHEGNTDRPDCSLITFILDGTVFDNFENVYPFDTGAFNFVKEFKELYFHRGMELSNFKLNGNVESAKKVVKSFFTLNANYINNDYKPIKSHSQMDFEVQTYENIIKSNINSRIDNRKYTVELIRNVEIDLNSLNLKQIIMPDIFLRDKDLMDILNDLGINNPLTYKLYGGNPNEYWSKIKEEFDSFQKAIL